MPATGAQPGGSCSRFVPYFYRLLQCGQTPGTTGTAAACFDAELWRLCRGFAGAAMAAVFRWSSMVWDGLCCLRAETSRETERQADQSRHTKTVHNRQTNKLRNLPVTTKLFYDFVYSNDT